MSTRIPALLASALLVAPLATQAQTLDFYDSVSGTSTTLLNGTLGPPGSISLESVPFSGSVTGSITLSGSGATFDFTLNEQGGGGAGVNAVNQFSMSGEFSAAGSGYYFGTTDNAMGDIQILTNSKGAITGATVDLTGDEYGTATQSQLTIGPTGVTGAYQGFIPPSTGYACTAAPLTFSGAYPNGIYTGPTIKNCNVNVSSSQSGQWTVAPEIDPTSAASGLALLLGGMAVLRGRRGVPKTS